MKRALIHLSRYLTLAALPGASHFFTRPQRLAYLDPLPMGRDISPQAIDWDREAERMTFNLDPGCFAVARDVIPNCVPACHARDGSTMQSAPAKNRRGAARTWARHAPQDGQGRTARGNMEGRPGKGWGMLG